MSLLLLFTSNALAYIDPACQDFVDEGGRQFYEDDQAQANFMANYFGLTTSYSGLHGAVPHDPGSGAISFEAAGVPPLSCERRLVLGTTKTEDTNKTPVVPRLRLSFAMPKLGPAVVYGSVGYIPPVPFAGVRNVILSGEIGVGVPLDSGLELGVRYHHTMLKTVGEIATPFVQGDTAYDDFFLGSSLGADGVVSFHRDRLTPYLAVGVMDVSTFFLVGDDAYIADNTQPYVGMTTSLGLQARVMKKVDLAGELYSALPPFSAEARDLGAGRVYTGRLRVGYVFGPSPEG